MTNAAVLDLTELADDLRRASKDAPKEVDKILADTANSIMVTMQILVPVRTGNLKRSIVVQASPGRYTIGPNGVEYATYVEFGTGTRGEFPTSEYDIRPIDSKALVFNINGKTMFASSVRHPGMRAKPYVRPAAKAYLDGLGERVADVGVEMIVGKQR